MYALVADVESYPSFLPWCGSARVEGRDGSVEVATLEIAKGPLRRRLTTRNRLRENSAIDMDLIDGPFERLEGRWRFEPLAGHGCKVSLHMDFEFSSNLLEKAVSSAFSEMASAMVDAFCRRARKVYGRQDG